MDETNKPTNEVAEVSSETLNKLASRDEDIRASGVIDIFEQHLPTIPKDYVLKNKDRKFVEDALNVAFDLAGGVPRLTKWGHENYAEFIKLWARMLPEAQKNDHGPAVVQVFHNVPQSPLDIGDIVDMDDELDDE
jgi:hypothetical protein